MADLYYVHLADDAQSFPLPAPLPGEALVDGDLKLTILDVGGVFNPRGDGEGAHLDGAASELIVRSGHSVQQTPEAILELRRILHLHLEEL